MLLLVAVEVEVLLFEEDAAALMRRKDGLVLRVVGLEVRLRLVEKLGHWRRYEEASSFLRPQFPTPSALLNLLHPLHLPSSSPVRWLFIFNCSTYQLHSFAGSLSIVTLSIRQVPNPHPARLLLPASICVIAKYSVIYVSHHRST